MNDLQPQDWRWKRNLLTNWEYVRFLWSHYCINFIKDVKSLRDLRLFSHNVRRLTLFRSLGRVSLPFPPLRRRLSLKMASTIDERPATEDGAAGGGGLGGCGSVWGRCGSKGNGNRSRSLLGAMWLRKEKPNEGNVPRFKDSLNDNFLSFSAFDFP